MRFSYKHLIALFTILAFSAKLLLPLVETYKQLIKYATAEQQAEKNGDEKEADEHFQKGKIEVADLISIAPFFSSTLIKRSTFSILKPAFLQAQYFAVPTPPPWC